jgi:hypothetical protein
MNLLNPSTKRLGMSIISLSLSFYALSIVHCVAQTSDSVSIPRSSWERLENAISGVSDAIKSISSSQPPTSTPALTSSTPPAPASPPATAQLVPDPDPIVTTSQVFLEGQWATEWPGDRISIELGRVEDPRYHGGRLTPEPDGSYRLSADQYSPCYYNIGLSPDHNAMFWVPTTRRVALYGQPTTCRPATMFTRIRDCCDRGVRDRECCGPRHARDCCDRPRGRECCDRPRDRDCCGRPRERDCCDRPRERGCCERHHRRGCCELRRDRDCCGEMPRPPVMRWRPPPCDYCGPREDWGEDF